MSSSSLKPQQSSRRLEYYEGISGIHMKYGRSGTRDTSRWRWNFPECSLKSTTFIRTLSIIHFLLHVPLQHNVLRYDTCLGIYRGDFFLPKYRWFYEAQLYLYGNCIKRLILKRNAARRGTSSLVPACLQEILLEKHE